MPSRNTMSTTKLHTAKMANTLSYCHMKTLIIFGIIIVSFIIVYYIHKHDIDTENTQVHTQMPNITAELKQLDRFLDSGLSLISNGNIPAKQVPSNSLLTDYERKFSKDNTEKLNASSMKVKNAYGSIAQYDSNNIATIQENINNLLRNINAKVYDKIKDNYSRANTIYLDRQSRINTIDNLPVMNL